MRTYGSGGAVTAHPTNSLWLKTTLDINAGASGGGIINQIFKSVNDNTYYWAGNYWGSVYDGGNEARRLTSYQFIKDYSFEF